MLHLYKEVNQEKEIQEFHPRSDVKEMTRMMVIERQSSHHAAA